MIAVAIGGSHVEPGAPLVAALASVVGDEVAAHGRRGWELSDWLAHPDELAAAVHGADVVIVVEWGGNGVPTASEVRRFDLAVPARTVWVAPPGWPASSRVASARADTRRVLLEVFGQARLIGLGARLDVGDLAGDGVHLTRAGAGRWLAQVRERIGAQAGGLFVAALFAAAVAVAVALGGR